MVPGEVQLLPGKGESEATMGIQQPAAVAASPSGQFGVAMCLWSPSVSESGFWVGDQTLTWDFVSCIWPWCSYVFLAVFLKLDSSQAILSLYSFNSLFTSLVTVLGVELVCTSLFATGFLSPVGGILLGVNRDVTTLNADCIIPGCIWGSSGNSLTMVMLVPSRCLASTSWSMMWLVRVISMGTFEFMVMLLMEPVPGSVKCCYWTLFLIWIEFHSSEGSIVFMCISSSCERGMGFPFLYSQTKPSEDIWKNFW